MLYCTPAEARRFASGNFMSFCYLPMLYHVLVVICLNLSGYDNRIAFFMYLIQENKSMTFYKVSKLVCLFLNEH